MISRGRIEYFEAEFPNQSKKLLRRFTDGLAAFGGEVTDSYERPYFSGSQSWRNPILFKVRLNWKQRFPFILETRIWLSRPSVLAVPKFSTEIIGPVCFRQMEPQTRLRRIYRIDGLGAGEVLDFHPRKGTTFYSCAEGILAGDMEGLFK